MCWAGSPGAPGVSGAYLDLVSPCCGKKVKYNTGDSWPSNLMPNEIQCFICECNKKYCNEELIKLEEYKNKNRSELIERMLNE